MLEGLEFLVHESWKRWTPDNLYPSMLIAQENYLNMYFPLSGVHYTLNSIISTFIMSRTLQYPETLGNRCSWFKSHSLSLHFSPLYHKICHSCKPPQKSTRTFALRHVSRTPLSCSIVLHVLHCHAPHILPIFTWSYGLLNHNNIVDHRNRSCKTLSLILILMK
jgi:hypothetical protein